MNTPRPLCTIATLLLIFVALPQCTPFFIPVRYSGRFSPPLIQASIKPPTTDASLLQELNSTFSYPDRITTQTPSFRCGYVSILGLPNMGKSTLMNAILNEKLCAATPLPQTTRHSILGILTTKDTQLLFLDTPGMIADPAYRLQSAMMNQVQSSLRDADVVIFVTSVDNDELPAEEEMKELHRKSVIVVLNKVDLADDDLQIQNRVSALREVFGDAAILILPVCAKHQSEDSGVIALKEILLGGEDVSARLRDVGRPYEGMFREGRQGMDDDEARGLIPLGPPLYGNEELTDRSERFLASEMIRQAIFLTLKKEVPYCCEVQIESFKDYDDILKIMAVVYVERDSQKGIVIGKQGAQIKKIGIKSRGVLEPFFEKQVHLNLAVKVESDWRKKDDRLKEFGYVPKKK